MHCKLVWFSSWNVCSRFLDDFSFGHIQNAWEDNDERFQTFWMSHFAVLWYSPSIKSVVMSSPSGHSSLVMCDNFGQIILMLSAALLLYDFFLYFVCIRVSALPGLQDRDERNAAEEKKRAYQLELQRQVHVCYLFGQWTGMSVICSDRYVCYLFGQICLLSVTCLDSLLPVRTGMSVICYLFGQSVTCSDSLLSVRTGCYLFRVEECYYIFFFWTLDLCRLSSCQSSMRSITLNHCQHRCLTVLNYSCHKVLHLLFWSLSSVWLTVVCDRWRKISVQNRSKKRRKKRTLFFYKMLLESFKSSLFTVVWVCRVLSLSDCRYSLNPLNQTRIDWVGRYRIRWTFKLSYAWHVRVVIIGVLLRIKYLLTNN